MATEVPTDIVYFEKENKMQYKYEIINYNAKL